MMNKHKKRTPELRFKGFVDDWEQRKLGDLTKIVRGSSPRPIQDSKWFDENSDIGWLRISDVTEQDGRIHYLEQKISSAGQKKTRVLTESHLLLSIAATVGKPVVNYVKTGVHDGFLIFTNPTFHQEFMFQWLEMFRKRWKKYGQPGSQVNLNSELVRNQEIKVPLFEEQKKIGEFLKQLDNTIALHQEKLSKIKQLKKSFLQIIFPKKGDEVPRLRFANFGDKWEQHKLREVANYRRGSFPQPYANKKWYDDENGMPFVQVVDVGENLKLVDNTKQNISKLAQPKSVFVEEGKVIITLQGSIGRVAITQYSSYVDRTLLIFENYRVPMNKYYFAYVIQQLFIKEKRRAPGGTIKTITKKALSDFHIYLTNKEEQTKIGSILSQFDHIIAFHQKRVEKLQSLKKAYLQKMFI